MKRFIWRSVVVVALLAIIGVVVGFFLLRSEPSHWAERQQRRATVPQADRNTQAQSLEARFTALLSYTNPTGDPGIKFLPDSASTGAVTGVSTPGQPDDGLGLRSISVSTDEVNAWLETRLPEWLANQNVTLPAEVQDPMFAVRDGLVILAFRYETQRVSQVVSMSFRPELIGQDTQNPQLVFALAGVSGGKLPFPSGTLVSRLEEQASTAKNEALTRVADAMAGRPFEPVMPLADGKRQVRLINYTLGDDTTELTVRLEPK